jgi:hypothetical protein
MKYTRNITIILAGVLLSASSSLSSFENERFEAPRINAFKALGIGFLLAPTFVESCATRWPTSTRFPTKHPILSNINYHYPTYWRVRAVEEPTCKPTKRPTLANFPTTKTPSAAPTPVPTRKKLNVISEGNN